MSEAVVRVEGLSRSFGDRAALEDVSLELPRGSVLGLIGRNGAGKTTLIQHLLGLLRAQRGTVRVLGRDPVAEPERVLGGIGYLSEDPALPGWMRIDELLRYTEAFYPTWDRAFAGELCDRFRLDPRQKVRTLSRGQQVRTALVCALAHRPELTLLDEPSSGLDPVVRRDVLEAILETVAAEGRTVVFSSHLLDEVERVSDRLVILEEGRVVVAGELDAVRARHSRVVVSGSGELPLPAFGVPRRDDGVAAEAGGSLRVLARTSQGTESTLICRGAAGEIAALLEEAGFEVLERMPASLDEIFFGSSRGESRAASRAAAP